MSTTQQTLNFFQRRLSAIQTDINDVTAMYLQALSNKNILLMEQCQTTLRKARRNQREVASALKAFQRPVRKIV